MNAEPAAPKEQTGTASAIRRAKKRPQVLLCRQNVHRLRVLHVRGPAGRHTPSRRHRGGLRHHAGALAGWTSALEDEPVRARRCCSATGGPARSCSSRSSGTEEPLPRPVPPRQRAVPRAPGRRAVPRPARPGRFTASSTPVPVGRVDEWYLCGPFGMVTGAESLLRRAASTRTTSTTRSSTSTTRVTRTEAQGRRQRRCAARGHRHRQPRRAHDGHPDAESRGDDPRRDPAGPARRALLVHQRRLRHLPRAARLG